MAKDSGELRFDAPISAHSPPVETFIHAVSSKTAYQHGYGGFTPVPNPSSASNPQRPRATSLSHVSRDARHAGGTTGGSLFCSAQGMQPDMDRILRSLDVDEQEYALAESQANLRPFDDSTTATRRPHIVGQGPSCSPGQMASCWPARQSAPACWPS